jgi:uncharacterized membrane-anchored protein YitT (DUF2179 family)
MQIKQSSKARARLGRIWRETRRLLLVFLGATMSALGYALFLVPHQIAAGGVSGISIIVNAFTGWPVGLMILAMNAPLLVLGYLQLGGWRFVYRTLVGVVIFSVGSDLFLAYLPRLMPTYPLTQDLLLNTIYGGIVGGIGGGLIYRAGSSLGGTGIIGRIVQRRTGQPLSQVYLYTDSAIIATAGLAFGWELALYALLVLFINGLATDYTLEGPSNTRTATIITDHPQAVVDNLLANLHRGVSYWPITGGYTGRRRFMVLCTISRAQVHDLKSAVAAADPRAFLTIGVGHQALGAGFAPLPPSAE